MSDNLSLCKHCKTKPRVSLYFCKECLEAHNKATRELKRKYRANGKCVMCGEPSSTRRCKECQILDNKYKDESLFIKSKKAKQGQFGGIKQISEIL